MIGMSEWVSDDYDDWRATCHRDIELLYIHSQHLEERIGRDQTHSTHICSDFYMRIFHSLTNKISFSTTVIFRWLRCGSTCSDFAIVRCISPQKIHLCQFELFISGSALASLSLFLSLLMCVVFVSLIKFICVAVYLDEIDSENCATFSKCHTENGILEIRIDFSALFWAWRWKREIAYRSLTASLANVHIFRCVLLSRISRNAI